jgi:hypothetical protein
MFLYIFYSLSSMLLIYLFIWHGGTHLQSQHSVGRGRRIGSSRPACVTYQDDREGEMERERETEKERERERVLLLRIRPHLLS